MPALRARTQRWVPRCSFFVVSSANQRSTRFSHEVHELWVFRQLPGVLLVGLEPEGPPDPRHRGLRQAELGGQRPSRPVGGVVRGGLQCPGDHLFDLLVGDGARAARARLVQEPFQALVEEPGPPPPRSRDIDVEFASHRTGGQPFAHPVSWARSWSVNVGSGCCSASCATPPTLSRPSRRATTGAGSVAATRRGAATTTTPSPTDRTPRVRRAPEDDLRKDPAGRSAPPRGAGGSGGGRHRVPRRTLPRVEGVNDLRRSRTRWAALSSKS